MKFIADFHIHSHYSIATSKKLTPEHLDYWAKIKGISVVGTGDFTHPKWINELKEKVEPSEIGLFQLKNDFIINDPITDNNILPVRFMLTAEISNIYKKNGKVRKVHNVIFAPDFNTVEKIQNELLRRKFNITSDGRPILGIDSKDLLDLVLNISPEIFFVPAHIWTPWFSVLGEKSGFDSIEECFEDLSQYINAVETGLSSDPPMNWACSKLDKYTLLSNSDAHSPEKLGRNANLFDSKLDYFSIIEAIKAKNTEHFLGTIDLFPQEGKYHYAGHRKCNVCLDPVSSLIKRGICPVCNKPITNGVMNRIIQLSDREKIDNITNRPPFYSIIPLKEIIAEINWKNSVPSVIEKEYRTLIKTFGNEFNILLHLPVEDIAEKGGQLLGEAIKRMRNRQVFIKEGYDGEYGIIKVFNENELKINAAQSTLFSYEKIEKTETPEPRKLLNFNLKEYREISKGIDFQDLPVSEPLKVKEEPAIYG
ncbi:MAG: hypothetical protein JXB17_03790, partial [Bacteroidales bacterium]|nr:hypothetical protein [Bacteroidales bacterium]